ncbi:MAG TPA: ATPase, T2SS/T4P/T4SS family, partial [Thermomicrobiales bacterium]|nr:ATPase, T2SS/T4P/T4SS family [Thermomicrobiales bacterium]
MAARVAADEVTPPTFGPWGPAATPRTEQVAERLIRERCQATIVETLGDREAAPSRPEELARVREIIGRHIAEYERWAPQAEGGAWLLTDPAATARRIYDSLFGYGILQPLMDDPEVEEVLCNGPLRVYTLRPEKRWEKAIAFDGDRDLLQQLKRWTAWAGQRLDESQPYVEAELPDGSRLSASIPPLSPDFPTCNIRKFVLRAGSLVDLVALGTLPEAAADFLDAAFRARVNVLISGGTASGKTTFLNALGNALTSPAERVVTIEETREL